MLQLRALPGLQDGTCSSHSLLASNVWNIGDGIEDMTRTLYVYWTVTFPYKTTIQQLQERNRRQRSTITKEHTIQHRYHTNKNFKKSITDNGLYSHANRQYNKLNIQQSNWNRQPFVLQNRITREDGCTNFWHVVICPSWQMVYIWCLLTCKIQGPQLPSHGRNQWCCW